MKRLFIILLLFQYLFSFTELRELFKLPSLIEHFNEHQAIKSDLGFFDFLSIHYFNVHEHGAENSKDKSLPFKDHEHCNTFFAQSPSISVSCISIATPELITDRQFNSTEELQYFSFHSVVWQPPKSV